MATMTLVYNYPTGYFSGSTPSDQTVSRISVSNAPSDYSVYKITSWDASFRGQEYTTAGATITLTTNGVSMSVDMWEAQSTTTHSGSGSSLSNAILNSAATGSLTVRARRKGGSSSGNLCLFKGEITINVEYEYNYSACSAPSTVSQNTVYPAAGGTAVINWSGAKAGTNNPITGYEIYRSSGSTYSLLKTVSSTSSSGTLTVDAPANMGDWYYYKVKTLGTVSGYDSGLSSVFANICAKTITSCSAPSSITISASVIDSGNSATISWSGAAAGTNNAITGYEIYVSYDNDSYTLKSTYKTTATNGSLTLTHTSSNDATVYYKVKTIGTVSGYNSGFSSTVSVNIKTYTKVGDITAQLAKTIAEGTVSLSWTSSTNGRNNPLISYKIQYQDSTDASDWGATLDYSNESAETTTIDATINPIRGCYRRFIITPIGTKSGYNGNTITTVAVRTNRLPELPKILAPSGTAMFNPNPLLRFTMPIDADNQIRIVEVKVGEGEWKPLITVSASMGTYQARVPDALKLGYINSVYLRVNDGLSLSEEMELKITYYNLSLNEAGYTKVMTNVYNYIRTATNLLRLYYGLPKYEFGDNIVAGDIVKAEDMNILLEKLEEVHKFIGSDLPFTRVAANELIKMETYKQLYNGLIKG